MTTIHHCSILEFSKGASNQAVAPGITGPLHATGCSGDSRMKKVGGHCGAKEKSGGAT